MGLVASASYISKVKKSFLHLPETYPLRNGNCHCPRIQKTEKSTPNKHLFDFFFGKISKIKKKKKAETEKKSWLLANEALFQEIRNEAGYLAHEKFDFIIF